MKEQFSQFFWFRIAAMIAWNFFSWQGGKLACNEKYDIGSLKCDVIIIMKYIDIESYKTNK